MALASLVAVMVGNSGGRAQSSTFLVVEHPGNLVLYDRYQQVLSPEERGGLLPFTPMKVEESRGVLGDGITPCMHVEILGDAYYLLLDGDGTLVGEKRAGSVKTYPGARAQSDTILVLHSGALLFEPAGSYSRPALHEGDQLKRIFQFETKTYVLQLKSPHLFGWLGLSGRDENRLWKILETVHAAEQAFPPHIRDSVVSRVAQVNNIISGLYSVFNRSSQHPRAIPRWTVESTDSSVTCMLETTDSLGSFQESTRYFAKDLESLVLGSGLGVFASSGMIVIRPK